jgi:hypothetical protein
MNDETFMITKRNETHRSLPQFGLALYAARKMTLAALAMLLGASVAALAGPDNDNRAPDVPAEITVETGNKVHFHGFGVGVQIYTWDGFSWGTAVPDATLFDTEGNIVADHFAGPRWKSNSGSIVLGAVVQPTIMVDSNAIPWLRLRALSAEGPGIFAGTTFIQRVNTTGGKAPAVPGICWASCPGAVHSRLLLLPAYEQLILGKAPVEVRASTGRRMGHLSHPVLGTNVIFLLPTTVKIKTTFIVVQALFLTYFLTSAPGQSIFIPDPGLSVAIHEALGKSSPLTQADMLNLTSLNASRRNISDITGLEAAHNLVSLHLEINHLSNVSIPATLTNLSVLDLSANPLLNCSLPSELMKLTSLTAEGCNLTNLTLPVTLIALTNLDLEGNELSGFKLASNLTSLVSLDLGFNLFTNFSLPGGLTNLNTFYFAGNPLTNFTIPPGLSGMTELNLSQNLLNSFTLPAGMTNLTDLDVAFNQLTNLNLPGDLRSLLELDLDFNRLTALGFLSNLTSLNFLHLRANQFTNLNLPEGLTGLTYLDISESPLTNIVLPVDLNQLANLRIWRNTNLTRLTLPMGLTNLVSLNLTENKLTNLVLPPDLGRLQFLNIGGNLLASVHLPAGLTNLTEFFVVGNLLPNLTLPPDMTHLVTLSFLANPLTTFVLPESLAASTNFTVNLGTLASLQSQGVSVFTYPLTIQLVRLLQLVGAFKFGITGPPGVYTILQSDDLTAWSVLGATTNSLGSINFTDTTAHVAPRRFYRVLLDL